MRCVIAAAAACQKGDTTLSGDAGTRDKGMHAVAAWIMMVCSAVVVVVVAVVMIVIVILLSRKEQDQEVDPITKIR
jgi:heme/copper-type cytochrome/quinol oxidase subunit 2